MLTIEVTVPAKVYLSEEQIEEKIEEAKLDDEGTLTREDAIYALCLEAFRPVNAAKIRDVIPDFSTLK